MSSTLADTSFAGSLTPRLIRAPKPYKAKSVRIPKLGRIIFTKDPGESTILSNEVFASHVHAVHRDGDGVLKDIYDLGSGLVTNVGVAALANDFNWASPSGAAVRTLGMANWHATGTSSTAAALTDIKLNTPSGFGGQTPVQGTQTFSLGSGASSVGPMIYKTVATINYTGTENVTEWGLFTSAPSSSLSVTTGTPLTAVTATSATVTGTPYTASSSTVQGEQMMIILTGTTSSYMLVVANSTSALWGAGNGSATNTVNTNSSAWVDVATGHTGTTPGSTEAFTLRPVMWDHKQFSSIGVVNGDSIQFSYSLTINSGG